MFNNYCRWHIFASFVFLLSTTLIACYPSGKTVAQRHGIVTFAPNIVETIFALGKGGQLVGVSPFCTYPPEAASLPQIGGYMNPDLEKIATLAPAAIVLQGEHDRVAEFARINNIPTINVNMDSLASIDSGIEALGAALNCRTEADALRANIQAELDVVRAAVQDRPKPNVLLISSRNTHDLNTLFTVGGPSFLSELVDIAGGANIFADHEQNYFEASKETVVMRKPDVILEFHPGENLSEEEQARYIEDWNQLGGLPAVRTGRVHLILEDFALIPGPRVAQTARQIARLLHPDAGIPEP